MAAVAVVAGGYSVFPGVASRSWSRPLSIDCILSNQTNKKIKLHFLRTKADF
jgi:hypothetical protein